MGDSRPSHFAGRRCAIFVIVGIVWWPGCASTRQAKTELADPIYKKEVSAAQFAYIEGAVEEAAKCYRDALLRAKIMDNSTAIAVSAYNLAACQTRMGEYEKAQVLLTEAYSECNDKDSLQADIMLAEIKLARLRSKPEEAWQLSELAAKQRGAGWTPERCMLLHVLRGHIANDLGRTDAARAELNYVEKAKGEAWSPSTEAEWARLRGRVLLANKEPAAAALEFESAARWFQRDQSYLSMVAALADAGAAYRGSEQAEPAARCFFEAARSAHAQGRADESLRLAKEAVSVSATAGDQRWQERAKHLLEDIQRDSPAK